MGVLPLLPTQSSRVRFHPLEPGMLRQKISFSVIFLLPPFGPFPTPNPGASSKATVIWEPDSGPVKRRPSDQHLQNRTPTKLVKRLKFENPGSVEDKPKRGLHMISAQIVHAPSTWGASSCVVINCLLLFLKIIFHVISLFQTVIILLKFKCNPVLKPLHGIKVVSGLSSSCATWQNYSTILGVFWWGYDLNGYSKIRFLSPRE